MFIYVDVCYISYGITIINKMEVLKMVILQPEDNVKVKTVKQQACITRLLQSSYFSKREFIELMRRNINQIITSYDASVLISYLISVLRFVEL